MKIKTRILVFVILLIPPLLGDGIRNILGINSYLWTFFQLIDLCFVIGYTLFIKRHRPSCPMILLALIYLTVFTSAFLEGVLPSSLVLYTTGFTMCFLFDYGLDKDFNQFVRLLYYVLMILICGNFLTIVCFPNGIYQTELYTQNWLLGYKNDHFGYIMTFIVFAALYSYIKYQKITKKNELLFVLCAISLYIVDSVMAFLMASMFCIFLIVFLNHRNNKLIRIMLDCINIKTFITISLGILFIIMFSSTFVILSNVLTKISLTFGRSTTFGGRIPIWNAAVSLIKESPIIGYGFVDANKFVELSGIPGGTHAHNYFFHILIIGGLICLAEHLLLYVETIRRLSKYAGYASYLIGFAIGLYLVAGITNINFYYTLFNPLFLLAYYGSFKVK